MEVRRVTACMVRDWLRKAAGAQRLGGVLVDGNTLVTCFDAMCGYLISLVLLGNPYRRVWRDPVLRVHYISIRGSSALRRVRRKWQAAENTGNDEKNGNRPSFDEDSC